MKFEQPADPRPSSSSTSTQGDKIDALGPTIYERWGKLDILVANAGMLGPLSPLPHISEDAWNNVITTNLSANFRLIRTLDPLLRHADAGRAVFVSSGAAAAKAAYWGPYSVSKAGLEALAKTYALKSQHQGTCQHHQSRPRAHRNASAGISRRRSHDLANSGGHRRTVPADPRCFLPR